MNSSRLGGIESTSSGVSLSAREQMDEALLRYLVVSSPVGISALSGGGASVLGQSPPVGNTVIVGKMRIRSILIGSSQVIIGVQGFKAVTTAAIMRNCFESTHYEMIGDR